VREWEYLKIDLNQHPRRGDELDLLNRAGADGWELVSMTSHNLADLKRLVEEDVDDEVAISGPPGSRTNGQDVREQTSSAHAVAIKFRDPATGDTWTGRGRMARWLKAKQDAGEDIERYRA
jgi:hypothetical protein